uniref:Glycosyl transferase family 1 domain-containing protein n=1 Tax=Periophthalmus magnuspinnatus TaxID=409849 RepID=A0A3B4A3A3_9GOBI
MKILFIACLSPKTGNNTTAERIRDYIESVGHTCELRDAAQFQSSAEVAQLLSQDPLFDGALAIHLFKAGRLLLVPFGVIFGGTDINEDVKVEQKRLIMEQVLQKARFAVAFTEKMRETSGLFLVGLFIGAFFTLSALYFFCSHCNVSTAHVDELRVFLLVCGLRRVKDPLYLVRVFSEWHCQDPLNVLIIIGPKVRPGFCLCHRTAGVYMAQERSQRELHAAMKKCFAVVNSSISEGMSAAILEAMHLGVPVVVRDIPGNTAIVEHEITGLLYSSPQDFVDQSQRLLSDPELRERLVRNGKVYVEEHHSMKQERETYQRLVATLH